MQWWSWPVSRDRAAGWLAGLLSVAAGLCAACTCTSGEQRADSSASPRTATPAVSAETDRLLRAALKPAPLGVDPQAPTAEWLGRLRERVRAQPRPPLFQTTSPEGAVERAKTALQQGCVVREHPPVSLQPPIAWGTARDGDTNWHFNLNAMYCLNDVLEAYEQTSDRLFVDAARRVMLDWIDFNITRNRKNAKKWYDMGTGYRAEKLAFILDDALRDDSSSPEQLGLLLSAAAQHVRVLADRSKLPKSNHSVFMMLGLAALCKRMPELSGCDTGSAYATKTLSKVLNAQFLKDEALHLEGAPSYHLLMSLTLLRLQKTGLFNDIPFLADLSAASARQGHRLFHPNGDVVQIGDSSGNITDFASKLSEIGVESPELRFVLSDGREGLEPAGASASFPKTGYAVFRSPWSQRPLSEHSFLFFSGATHRGSHQHRDHFSFEWSERGRAIVVDSGKYTYNRGAERDFFMSTRAGNALEIDDNDVSLPAGLSSLRSFGQTGPLHFVDAVAARDASVEHTRLLVLRMGEWLCVVDRLNAPAAHRYRQWFGFHEDAEAAVDTASDLVTVKWAGSGPVVFVQSRSSAGTLDPVLVKGVTQGRMQGWISREYQTKVPRNSLAFERAGSKVDLVTLLSLDAAPARLSAIDKNGELRVSWQREGGTEGFSYRVEAGQGKVQGLRP